MLQSDSVRIADTETTGVGPTDLPIEIAITKSGFLEMEVGVVTHLIHLPLARIVSGFAWRLWGHEISREDLAAASKVDGLNHLLAQLRSDKVKMLLFWNAEFDCKMIHRAMLHHLGEQSAEEFLALSRVKVFCLMMYANKLYSQHQHLGLQLTAFAFGIEPPRGVSLHRAEGDVRLTRQVLCALFQRPNTLSLPKLAFARRQDQPVRGDMRALNAAWNATMGTQWWWCSIL